MKLLIWLENRRLDREWKRKCERMLPDLIQRYLERCDDEKQRLKDICEAFEGVEEHRIITALSSLVKSGAIQRNMGLYWVESI